MDLDKLSERIQRAREQTQRTVAMSTGDFVKMKPQLDNIVKYTVIPENYQYYVDNQMPWTTCELIFHSTEDLLWFTVAYAGQFTPVQITLS